MRNYKITLTVSSDAAIGEGDPAIWDKGELARVFDPKNLFRSTDFGAVLLMIMIPGAFRLVSCDSVEELVKV